MEKQPQKPQTKQQELISPQPLKNVILAGDKHELNYALREFKTREGLVKYENVFAIPMDNRIAKLSEKNYKETHMVIAAALHLAFESMNLKRGMTADQEVDLAETIIDSSSEDWLAMEDLMLFLQRLIRGQYGVLYQSLDIPTFMEKFELYRQERHEALIRIRNEKEAQYKVTGSAERSNTTDEISEHFANLGNQMSNMKQQIGRLKEENYSLKMDKE